MEIEEILGAFGIDPSIITGSVMQQKKNALLCMIASDCKLEGDKFMMRNGSTLYFAERALSVADIIADYANQQEIDVIVSVTHRDTILAAYTAGLKGSPAFAIVAPNDKGELDMEGPDAYPDRPLKFLLIGYSMGDGQKFVDGAKFLRNKFKDASVQAYALIDAEMHGMSNLAAHDILLARFCTKTEILAHLDIHVQDLKDRAEDVRTAAPQPSTMTD